MKSTIIISAGGTGGHIFPAIAVAKELAIKYNIIWVGAKTGLENTLVPKHGFKLETVSVGGVRNKGMMRKLLLPLTLLRSGFECLKILLKHKPVAVVGFGGYATFPICMTAGLLAKVVIIHEQNSVAGLTNKLSSKFAKKILIAFPNVLPSKKTYMVGNPTRREICAIYSSEKYANLNTSKLKILIVGGSLGAKVLNEVVPIALGLIKDKVMLVTHQVGRSDVADVEKLYRKADLPQANVVNFIDDMAQAYQGHDLIICRSGAATVSEVTVAGIVAIFVPYPHAVDDHQTTNAEYLSKNDAAILITQPAFNAKSLAAQIEQLTTNRFNQIGQNAHKLAILDSTQLICNHITSCL
jgi:UDP-N-acetylglucosamine--N-acetylmuramyl-(pentapeptide) pyrophosphoryl-undecaprenol N-acetylglucosamine transferase